MMSGTMICFLSTSVVLGFVSILLAAAEAFMTVEVASLRRLSSHLYSKGSNKLEKKELVYPLRPDPVLQTKKVFVFDVNEYPLADRVMDVLGLDASNTDLDQIHKLSDWHVDRSGNRVNQIQVAWNANRNRNQPSSSRDEGVRRFIPDDAAEAYERFDQVYRSFIADVVAPIMGGGRVLFQRAPTLRVMTPLLLPSSAGEEHGPLSLSSSSSSSSSVMSKLHNDMEYHHQPSEINFWLPLTPRVWGSNSLWTESSPNAGDFAPLELAYGEMARFYGNQCRHYASENTTGSSRVSLDFRAVSDASGGHNPSFRKGKRRGAKARYKDVFDVPDFYSEVTVPRTSAT